MEIKTVDDRDYRVIELMKKMTEEGVFLIISKCLECGSYYNVVDGGVVFGISHGFCGNDCVDRYRKRSENTVLPGEGR